MVGSGVSFVTSLPSQLPPWLGVIKPYSKKVWIGILCTVVAFGPVALFILRISRREVSLFKICSWMQNVIFSRGESNVLTPTHLSSYLIMTTWCIFGTVISLSYSSYLVTALTLVSKEKPMDTWQQFLQSDYKVGFTFGTNVHNRLSVRHFFDTAKSDSL